MFFRPLIFLLVLIIFFGSTAAGHHHHHKRHMHHHQDRDLQTTGILNHTDINHQKIDSQDVQMADHQMLSRPRRVPDAQGVKRRICGHKVTTFVFQTCGNACSSTTEFNLASHCCTQQCTSAEVKIHCCPSLLHA